MYTIIVTYKHLIYQITLTITLYFILNFFSISSLFLNALNTYIHPDDANPNPNPNKSPNSIAIKTPNSIHQNPNNHNHNHNNNNLSGFQSLSSRTSSELKQRKKIKDKFQFDESKAQIFRLKLGDPQIKSRLFYDSYRFLFDSLVLFCFSFILFEYFCVNLDNDVFFDLGVVKNGSFVVILIGVFGFFRVLVSVFRVSIERSAFKRSDRQLGLILCVLGFVFSLVICLGIFPVFVDFEFGLIDGFGRVVMAVLCGVITGVLYMGSGKNARAFWLGTDQIRCSLSIVSCGWFGQVLFYANYLVTGFTSMLWIKPFGGVFVKMENDGIKGGLLDNVGMSEDDFDKFRLFCLLLTGVLQIVALRLNVQAFLNEAVLSWYQRLHSSTVPDMDYSRAKVFLHNHYWCLAVVQFFAPPALILFSLGLSQVGRGLFDEFQGICGVLPCSIFVKDVAVFVAWWVAFVWFIFSSSYLAIYRRGMMHIS